VKVVVSSVRLPTVAGEGDRAGEDTGDGVGRNGRSRRSASRGPLTVPAPAVLVKLTAGGVVGGTEVAVCIADFGGDVTCGGRAQVWLLRR